MRDTDPDSEYARHVRPLRDADAAGDRTAHAALIAELAHRQAVHRAVEALRAKHRADEPPVNPQRRTRTEQAEFTRNTEAEFIDDCD